MVYPHVHRNTDTHLPLSSLSALLAPSPSSPTFPSSPPPLSLPLPPLSLPLFPRFSLFPHSPSPPFTSSLLLPPFPLSFPCQLTELGILDREPCARALALQRHTKWFQVGITLYGGESGNDQNIQWVIKID